MDQNPIEKLLAIQAQYNYLPQEELDKVTQNPQTSLIQVWQIVNFYKAFSLKPRGKHHIKVCTGTACHVRGASRIVNSIQCQLSLEPGETTEDGTFSLESVSCIGCCALGPVVVMDEEAKGHMSPGGVKKLIAKIGKN